MKIRELSAQIEAGNLSCVQLAQVCLKRIEENDRAGRKLNSVALIDPDVLKEAEKIDEEIRRNGRRSPLHGVPVLLKDNIDIKGMPTTAGSLALQDLIAEKDAFITEKLRKAGALILGKTNLSEFAYFMSRNEMPSGYSSLGGQVVHAYVPGRDPSGSSSGSAVAVAARFVPYTIGTETDGSLMSPSIANAIVSLKPTVGLVSRSGILPLSCFQDTAGPMGTSVEDIAEVLQVIAGKDEDDPASATCRIDDYTKALKTDGTGLKVGIYRCKTREEDDVALQKAKEILQAAGAEVKEVGIEKVMLDETECLKNEFRYSLNRYLDEHGSACRSLSDIIAYNRAHPEKCLVHGQDLLEASDACSGDLTEPGYVSARNGLTEEAHRLLDGTLEKYGVHCLLSAGARPQSNLAPVSQNPCMTIPAVSQNGENFEPVSYYLMAGAFQESVLIHTAYILEDALQVHCRPSWVDDDFSMTF
ncbi:MAG: hypothetical protein K6G61_11285 [Solobacterium sp.]|nr:hypothetical protein [Solobacterium sp.]